MKNANDKKLSLFPTVVICLGMFFLPESPLYLVSNGKDEKALQSLQWLRRVGMDEAKNDLEAIRKAANAQVSN